MIRKLTTLWWRSSCPYNLLYRFLTKICKAEFLDTKLLVLYLGLKNDYNHELKLILNYIFNATVWWKLDVNH